MNINNKNQEEILRIIRSSENNKQAFKLLGISRDTFKKYCLQYNIDTSHFKTGRKSIHIEIKCKQCGKIFPSTQSKNMKQFCSSSCAAQFNNKHRVRNKWTEEQKRKFSIKILQLPDKESLLNAIETSNTIQEVCMKMNIAYSSFQAYCSHLNINISEYFPKLGYIKKHKPYVITHPRKYPINTIEKICKICGKSFKDYKWGTKQTCNKICGHKLISIKQSLFIREHRSHIRGPHQQSYMEFSFEKWLNENGYKKGIHGYLTEVHFYNPTTKKNGFADFVFPKLHLIIELDGTHHIKRKELDQIRDEYLNSRGWKVIRITQREYIKKEKVKLIYNLLGLARLPGIEPGTKV